MNSTIAEIIKNNQSGSHEIFKSSLLALKDFLKNDKSKNKIVLSDALNDVVRNLNRAHKNIVILQKNTSAIAYYLKRLAKTDKDINSIKKQTIEKINNLIADSDAKAEKIGALGARLIFNKNNVLTISYSTIIKEILINAKKINRNFDIYCLESRPMLEGQQFAVDLAKAGIQTHLITDVMMAKIMPDINIVFSGVDRLYESGFINKIGTLPLAIVSKKFNVPFYIASETDKILKEIDRTIRISLKNPKEVFKDKIRKLSVLNYYFEEIPYKFVTKIICEEGVFETHEFIKWYLKD